jgi:DNA-binding transcriptional LysR family regulator
MSAAGRDMGLSPAVVSKRISHMEERLGARLFQRTTRQLKLTETGRGFYERVVNILSDIEEAEAFVSQLNEKANGTLRVTAPATFGRMHIAPYLATFMRQHPDLSIDIQLTDTMVDIISEVIDLAIRIGVLDDSSLVAKKLAPCQQIICATPEYLEQHGNPRTLSDLSKHNCLTPIYRQVWRLEGPEGLVTWKPTGSLRTNSSDIIYEALMSSFGIALRSTWAISDELKSGRLKVVMPEFRAAGGVAVYAVYPCRQYVPAKLRVFVDFLAQRYGSEPYWDRGLDLLRRQAQLPGGRQQPALRATS